MKAHEHPLASKERRLRCLRLEEIAALHEVMTTLGRQSAAAARIVDIMDKAKKLGDERGRSQSYFQVETSRLARDYVDTMREVMLELAPEIPAAGRLARIIVETENLRAEILSAGTKNADYR